MAPTFDRDGLLDVAKLQARDYAPLPKGLAAYKPNARDGADTDSWALFPRPPDHSDLDALLRVRSVDDSLHACFSSLLGGLSSGAQVIMGSFRALDDGSVVVRMHAPARPRPFTSLPPIYFRVPHSHAQLAVERGWVPNHTAPWLMLYAALYYSLIGDPKVFYKRPELGGPDNAAWLVFYGKDSARALPDPGEEAGEEEQESGAQPRRGKAGAGPASPQALRALYSGIFAHGDNRKDALDLKLLAGQVFAVCSQDPRGQGSQHAKTWQSLLVKHPVDKVSSLSAPLAAPAPLPEAALRSWLRTLRGLPSELRESLLWFLELNGALDPQGQERYSKAARSLWRGVSDYLKHGVPVAVELDGDDPLRTQLQASVLPTGTLGVGVVAAGTVDLGQRDAKRGLRTIGLLARPGSAHALTVLRQLPFSSLQRTRSGPPCYPLDAEQVLARALRVHVGARALALRASSQDEPNFSLDLPRSPSSLLKWPRR